MARKQAILIWISFVVSVAFLATPEGPKVDIFLFFDKEKTVEALCYYGGEHYVLILLASILVVMAKGQEQFKSYMMFFKFYLGYQIVDFLDFILTFNSVWFYIFGVPISMNTVSFAVMTYLLACLTVEEMNKKL